MQKAESMQQLREEQNMAMIVLEAKRRGDDWQSIYQDIRMEQINANPEVADLIPEEATEGWLMHQLAKNEEMYNYIGKQMDFDIEEKKQKNRLQIEREKQEGRMELQEKKTEAIREMKQSSKKDVTEKQMGAFVDDLFEGEDYLSQEDRGKKQAVRQQAWSLMKDDPNLSVFDAITEAARSQGLTIPVTEVNETSIRDVLLGG